MDINLYGVSRGCFMAIDRMGRSNGGRGGRIVNISSVAGFTVILKIVQKFLKKGRSGQHKFLLQEALDYYLCPTKFSDFPMALNSKTVLQGISH